MATNFGFTIAPLGTTDVIDTARQTITNLENRRRQKQLEKIQDQQLEASKLNFEIAKTDFNQSQKIKKSDNFHNTFELNLIRGLDSAIDPTTGAMVSKNSISFNKFNDPEFDVNKFISTDYGALSGKKQKFIDNYIQQMQSQGLTPNVQRAELMFQHMTGREAEKKLNELISVAQNNNLSPKKFNQLLRGKRNTFAGTNAVDYYLQFVPEDVKNAFNSSTGYVSGYETTLERFPGIGPKRSTYRAGEGGLGVGIGKAVDVAVPLGIGAGVVAGGLEGAGAYSDFRARQNIPQFKKDLKKGLTNKKGNLKGNWKSLITDSQKKLLGGGSLDEGQKVIDGLKGGNKLNQLNAAIDKNTKGGFKYRPSNITGIKDLPKKILEGSKETKKTISNMKGLPIYKDFVTTSAGKTALKLGAGSVLGGLAGKAAGDVIGGETGAAVGDLAGSAGGAYYMNKLMKPEVMKKVMGILVKHAPGQLAKIVAKGGVSGVLSGTGFGTAVGLAGLAWTAHDIVKLIPKIAELSEVFSD